jgi:hypothetical protein
MNHRQALPEFSCASDASLHKNKLSYTAAVAAGSREVTVTFNLINKRTVHSASLLQRCIYIILQNKNLLSKSVLTQTFGRTSSSDSPNVFLNGAVLFCSLLSCFRTGRSVHFDLCFSLSSVRLVAPVLSVIISFALGFCRWEARQTCDESLLLCF